MSYPPSVRMSSNGISLGGGISILPVELLGKGSLASVHRAWYRTRAGIEHPVALKLFGALSTDERDNVIEAVLRAAKRTACVSHPNVAAVFDAGVLDAVRPFYVRELVSGSNLRDLLALLTDKGVTMPVAAALHVALEVAEGLSAARLADGPEGRPLGIVHGDLSARKVYLTELGDVKVTDFECGGVRNAASSIRSMKQIALRVVSAAPEVVCGESADSRSDVFSLGLLVREMLAGPRFVSKASDSQIVEWARDGLVECSQPLRPLPAELVRVLEGALHFDPQNRYPNVDVLAFELRRLIDLLGARDGRTALRRVQSQFMNTANNEDDASSTWVDLGPPVKVAPPAESGLRLPPKDERTDRDVFTSVPGFRRAK